MVGRCLPSKHRDTSPEGCSGNLLFCNLPLGDSAHRRTCRLRFRQSFWQGMETFVQLFSLVWSDVHACQLLHFGHFVAVRRFQRKHCCIFDEKHKNTQPLLKQLCSSAIKNSATAQTFAHGCLLKQKNNEPYTDKMSA